MYKYAIAYSLHINLEVQVFIYAVVHALTLKRTMSPLRITGKDVEFSLKNKESSMSEE